LTNSKEKATIVNPNKPEMANMDMNVFILIPHLENKVKKNKNTTKNPIGSKGQNVKFFFVVMIRDDLDDLDDLDD
jgi:hypothetical protein